MTALRTTPRALRKVNTAGDADLAATALPSPAWIRQVSRRTYTQPENTTKRSGGGSAAAAAAHDESPRIGAGRAVT